MGDWYKDWFASDDYLNVYSHRDENEAKKFLSFILERLNLASGSTVVDAACGAGRHANILNSFGFNVIAFDLSKTLLRKALENYGQKERLLFYRGDIRFPAIKKGINGIFNLFTSFGYFDTDHENFLFPQKVYELLTPDGFYVLDFLNSNYVSRNLVDKSEKVVNGKKIIETRKIVNGRVIKEISLISDANVEKYIESVRLYSFDEIKRNFEMIGYKSVDVFGSYSGDKFDLNLSKRLIVIFRK